jgi:hypothetical protein
MIEFTHLFTGKKVIILDAKTVAGYLTGDAKPAPGVKLPAGDVTAVWLLIDKVRDPLPVMETEAEVRQKLGLEENK